MISQMDLCFAVFKALEKHKTPVNTRQQNAVIRAVNDIMDELRRSDVQAQAGCGLHAWLASDSTGLSSRHMARVLAPHIGARVPDEGINFQGEAHYPHDPGDFGRCIGLLKAVPELRPYLSTLASGHGRVWARLIAAWPELEATFLAEKESGFAPKTYALMQDIISRAKEPEK